MHRAKVSLSDWVFEVSFPADLENSRRLKKRAAASGPRFSFSAALKPSNFVKISSRHPCGAGRKTPSRLAPAGSSQTLPEERCRGRCKGAVPRHLRSDGGHSEGPDRPLRSDGSACHIGSTGTDPFPSGREGKYGGPRATKLADGAQQYA